MKTLTFAKRCLKEILRDPINLMFGFGFPIVLLLLLSLMQKNMPIELFNVSSLTPGISVFGLSFITLFSATLIAKDRESSFLQRLYSTPLKSYDFILGYILPLIPLAITQTTICYLVALILGLPFTTNIIYAIIMIIPISCLYISLGLLCGSVFNSKQVGGICGALLTNVSAWLSGVWFDLNLLGQTLGKVAKVLPFLHAVELERKIINGNFSNSLNHFYIILFYSIITTIVAILLFLKQMKKH